MVLVLDRLLVGGACTEGAGAGMWTGGLGGWRGGREGRGWAHATRSHITVAAGVYRPANLHHSGFWRFRAYYIDAHIKLFILGFLHYGHLDKSLHLGFCSRIAASEIGVITGRGAGQTDWGVVRWRAF